MFKKIFRRLFSGSGSTHRQNGFFLDVRCNECSEDFHLFINTSTDLLQEFAEDKVSYILNKEIIGASCRNRIRVIMTFDSNKRILSRNVENGTFIEPSG